MGWIKLILVLFFITFVILFLGKSIDFLLMKDKPNPFVQRSGTYLIFNKKPFVLKGVNVYDLAYEDNDAIAKNFALLHSAGVTTIRFWLFGDGIPNGFQTLPGIYNETRFKQADYVLYEAHKYNMKVIPVLTNNWKDYGGKDQYVEWIGKNTTDDTLFYIDQDTKTLFERYITYVLSRKNTYTKQTYTKDTAILGWDIMNEPRSSDQNAMNSFLISIATFIKQQDKNHLVFAGTETASVINSRPSDQGKSSDLCASPAIDICSIHLYLFNDTQPLFNSYSDITQYLTEQSDYAKSINKPLLMEEFGIASNTKPFGKDQLSVMKQIIKEAKQDTYAGFLIWNWSQIHESPFTFSPSSTTYSLSDLQELLTN